MAINSLDSNELVLCGDSSFFKYASGSLALSLDSMVCFSSGERCREYLKQHSLKTVLIGPCLVDVSPLNLTAALHHDAECLALSQSSIFLFKEEALSGSFVSRAHNAGAREVLLLEDIGNVRASSFAPSEASTDSEQISKGNVITFVSGRGGCGKSTLSLMSALAFAKKGLRVALLDFDLQFGDLSYLLGMSEVHRLNDLLMYAETPALLSSHLANFETTIQEEVAFFAAPRKPEEGDKVVPHTRCIIEAFKATYDLIIVNTGGFWNDSHVDLVQSSNRVVLVCDQRSSSLDGCKKALDLCVRLGVPLVHLTALLNKYDSKGAVDETSASMALKGTSIFTVSDGGREVDELVGLGCPEELFILRNSCAQSIARYANETAASLGIAAHAKDSIVPAMKKKTRFSSLLHKGGA